MLESAQPELLDEIADRLRALADPIRLRLMQEMGCSERTIGELVEAVGTTQPNVSRHVDRLEQAGWVTRRRDGNRVLVRIRDHGVDRLCELVCALIRGQAEDAARAAGFDLERKES